MKYIVWIFIILMSLTSCGTGSDKQVDTEFLTGAYVSEFHELDLAGMELTAVPNFEKYLTGSYIYDVWSVDLQSNNIKKIDSKAFDFFPNLKEVNLSYNKIEKITLGDLPIEKLLIHKNEIESADLWGLSKLREVNIGYNQLESAKDIKLPEGLQILELQHNKLEDISGVEKLTELTKIKLEFNQLEDADMVLLKDLKKLKFISVGKNKLSEDLEKGFINFNEVMSEKE
jgi:Leucine-rich repeat (LRR) protein